MKKYLILFSLTIFAVIFIYETVDAKQFGYKINIKQPVTHIKEVDKKINMILEREINILKYETKLKEEYLKKYNFETELRIDYQIFSYKNINTLIMKELLQLGGANPEIKLYTIVYNDKIELTDKEIFVENYLTILSKLSNNKLKNIDINPNGLDPIKENFDNYYFSKKGMHLIFDYYQIASRPYGNLEIILPYNEVCPILKANLCG